MLSVIFFNTRSSKLIKSFIYEMKTIRLKPECASSVLPTRYYRDNDIYDINRTTRFM